MEKIAYFATKPKFTKWEIQDELVLINLSRFELGYCRKLLHTLDLTFVQLQHTYIER